jgi:hypothetical protein
MGTLSTPATPRMACSFASAMSNNGLIAQERAICARLVPEAGGVTGRVLLAAEGSATDLLLGQPIRKHHAP